MFPWLVSFLVFSTAQSVWFRYLDYRQIRRLQKRQLPTELKDSVTPDEFHKSVAYSLDKLVFSVVNDSVSHLLNLVFYLYFLFPYLWDVARQFNQQVLGVSNEYCNALAFSAIQIPIFKVLSLPFELYEDFVIEERHGFNKKTLKLFIMDDVKKLLLTVFIGSPILCLIIWVIKWGGRSFYIWLTMVSMVLVFVMMTVYPNWIAPLFNTFEPLHDEELKAKIEELAKSINYPLKKIYQMDGSLRSSHSNAYMYGFGSNKRIVLYDTLLNTSHDQIIAVVAHELGHWKLKHTLKNMVVSFAQMFIMFYLFGFVLYSDHQIYESFGYTRSKEGSIVIGLLVFSNLFEPISLLTTLGMTCLSRVFEFQADRFSAELGMSKHLQGALLTLQRANLSSFTVDTLFAWFHYSHPHLIERLKALRSYDKTNEKRNK